MLPPCDRDSTLGTFCILMQVPSSPSESGKPSLAGLILSWEIHRPFGLEKGACFPSYSSSYSSDLMRNHEGRGASRLSMLLLLLMLCPPLFMAGIVRMPKCPSMLIRENDKVFNYYRPGDHIIGGVVSATQAIFQLHSFNKAPASRFFW